MNKQIENLNMVQALDGEMVEINREINQGYVQEFSNELSVIVTNKELILDNLHIIDEEENEISISSIHIIQKRILEIEENYSNDIEILTLDGLITISKM